MVVIEKLHCAYNEDRGSWMKKNFMVIVTVY